MSHSLPLLFQSLSALQGPPGLQGTAGDSAADPVNDGLPGSDPASGDADAVAGGLEQFSSSLEQFFENPSVETATSAFGPMLIDLGLAILGIIVLLIVVVVVSRWTHRLAERGLRKLRLDQTATHFLALIAKYAIWILAIPVAMEMFGVKATSVTAVVGAAGLAIGLALQGSLSNVASGIMLLVLRPIHIGHMVHLGDEEGTIEDIGIFYTTVRLLTNESVMIPNGEVLSNKIENYSKNTHRRLDVPIGVAYGTDLEAAQKALLEAAHSNIPLRSTAMEPAVLLTDFGDSSINFVVMVHCQPKDYYDARHEVVLAINNALASAKIEIPFPQRVLHITGNEASAS